jgi:hypothetical protein
VTSSIRNTPAVGRPSDHRGLIDDVKCAFRSPSDASTTRLPVIALVSEPSPPGGALLTLVFLSLSPSATLCDFTRPTGSGHRRGEIEVGLAIPSSIGPRMLLVLFLLMPAWLVYGAVRKMAMQIVSCGKNQHRMLVKVETMHVTIHVGYRLPQRTRTFGPIFE